MTTGSFVTTPSLGFNFNLTYTAYDQTAVSSATNSPDNPGPPVAVGTVANGTGDTTFVFVKASAAIAAGDVCQITTATQFATGVTTTNALLGNQIGVAQVAIASGSYGWLQRNGACSNISVAAVVANVQLATTATAGQLDDVVTTGFKNINGIVITTSGGPGVLAGTLNYPVVGTTN